MLDASQMNDAISTSSISLPQLQRGRCRTDNRFRCQCVLESQVRVRSFATGDRRHLPWHPPHFEPWHQSRCVAVL